MVPGPNTKFFGSSNEYLGHSFPDAPFGSRWLTKLIRAVAMGPPLKVSNTSVPCAWSHKESVDWIDKRMSEDYHVQNRDRAWFSCRCSLEWELDGGTDKDVGGDRTEGPSGLLVCQVF